MQTALTVIVPVEHFTCHEPGSSGALQSRVPVEHWPPPVTTI